LLDRERAFATDAGDVAQPRRLLAEYPERVGAERIDDLVRIYLADARHQAAAEVFADPIHIGGKLGREAGDLELRAMLRVARPFARQPERFAALAAWQRPDDRDSVLVPFRPELGD